MSLRQWWRSTVGCAPTRLPIKEVITYSLHNVGDVGTSYVQRSLQNMLNTYSGSFVDLERDLRSNAVNYWNYYVSFLGWHELRAAATVTLLKHERKARITLCVSQDSRRIMSDFSFRLDIPDKLLPPTWS